MTDYISREKALEIRVSEGYNNDGILFIPYRDLREHLRSIPAADVAPVVRCRECKWGRDVREGGEFVWCGKPYAPPWASHVENWYCADGEQKCLTKEGTDR